MKNKYSLDFWNEYYKKDRKIQIKPKGGFFCSYDIYLCDKIIEKYLPLNKENKEQIKICEIGSGDGKLLKKIADKFNYKPFGIEYASRSTKQAEEMGINVIEKDVFDKTVLEKYREYFDVVYSYGFVEHILPPEKAIEAHLQLLKKGGYFFIQIPRLKGFNHFKVKLFSPDLISQHNLSLMEGEALESVCMQKGVQKLFCSNYGTFKLRIYLTKKNVSWYILKTICGLDYFLNPVCKLIFKDKGFETKFFSPSVIFIGRKI